MWTCSTRCSNSRGRAVLRVVADDEVIFRDGPYGRPSRVRDSVHEPLDRSRVPLLPVPVDARGPVRPGSEDLDAESIRIEDEERVVARDVAVLLRRVVDPIVPPRTPLVRRVDLLCGVDLARQVFESHAVVAMGTAVGGTKAEPFVSEAQIDDLLAAAVGRIAL